jgi:hypothetical protein
MELTSQTNKKTTLRCCARGRTEGSNCGVQWVSAVLLALLSFQPAPCAAQREDTFVAASTVQQLRWAFENVEHVVLTAHLDLSWEPAQPNSAWMYPLQGVRSLRVRVPEHLAFGVQCCNRTEVAYTKFIHIPVWHSSHLNLTSSVH